MKSSKLLCVLLAVLTGLVVLTASVAVPILCRPFYYAHIGPLKLKERTGLTEAEIKTAFDEMLDYCLGAEEFSTGVLAWSEEGKAHFTDVRGLFLLDLRVLGAALCLLAAVLLYARFAGALAALDFGRAFVLFHALFFPGKDNWMFDPWEDQIISILPQEFFRNCALLILALLTAGCAALIVLDLRRGRREG